ncbi:hypothetical protein D3C78_1784430 [compost metagenome]
MDGIVQPACCFAAGNRIFGIELVRAVKGYDFTDEKLLNAVHISAVNVSFILNHHKYFNKSVVAFSKYSLK